MHANPIPGHTYLVALLEKKKSSYSADTSVAQTRRVDANAGNVRNMMKKECALERRRKTAQQDSRRMSAQLEFKA